MQEQLQAERDLRAALEVGLSMSSGQFSSARSMDGKVPCYLEAWTVPTLAGFILWSLISYLFTLDKGRARGDCSCWSWCCKVKTEGCRASPPTQSTTATPVWLYSGCKWSPSPPSWSLLAAVRYKFYSFKFLWDVSGSLVAVVFGFLQLSESKGICQQFMPYTKIHFLSLHQWIMLNLL